MSLIKSKNYLLLRTGWSVSDLGSQLQNFAFSLYVLTLTGSAVKFAVTLCMQVLPMILLAPLSGYFADRFNRKLQIVLYDLLSACVVLLFFLLYLWKGALEIYQIYLCVAILSVLQTFFRSVATCLSQNVVDPADYTKQKSLDTTLSSLTSVFAPAITGLLYGLSSLHVILLCNIASFLVSAALEATLKLQNPQAAAPTETRSPFSAICEGFHYIASNAFIKSFLLTLSLLNFILPGVEIGITVISKNAMHLSPAIIGIENSALSLGFLAGALLSGLLGKEVEQIGLRRIIHISLLVTSGAFLVISLWLLWARAFLPAAANVLVFICMNAVIMVAESILTVQLSAELFRVVPNEMMGRTNATVNSVIIACAPLGQLTAGLLLQGVPYFIVYLAQGILCFLLYGFSMLSYKKSTEVL